MIEFAESSLLDLQDLRVDRLKSLPYFQELFLEWEVQKSFFRIIKVDHSMAGYYAWNPDGKLVEFYLLPEFLNRKEEIFDCLLDSKVFHKALCLSFDFSLLSCCVQKCDGMKVCGALFRSFTETKPFLFESGIHSVIAEPKDLEFLKVQKDGLYETMDELVYLVNNKSILMFFDDKEIVGCGFLIKVHSDFNFFDIGMWVNPEFRKQGNGRRIISYLKNLCLSKGWVPLCGCAIENKGSIKTLEANGFQTVHNLLEFHFSNI